MEVHTVGPCYPCYLLVRQRSSESRSVRNEKMIPDSKSENPDASLGSASKILRDHELSSFPL